MTELTDGWLRDAADAIAAKRQMVERNYVLLANEESQFAQGLARLAQAHREAEAIYRRYLAEAEGKAFETDPGILWDSMRML